MHQIRRDKRTTISEVIQCFAASEILSKIGIGFYFNFSVESSSFIFTNFKSEKL